MASASKRVARREPAGSPPPSKRARNNPGAVALSDMASSMKEFGNAIVTAVMAPSDAATPASVRLTNAIGAAIKLESSWLTTDEMSSFIDVLRQDISYSDAYLALQMPEAAAIREQWVRARVSTL